MNPIQLVDLKKNYNSIKGKIDEAIKKTIKTCYFINGPEVNKFEKEFANFTEADHCISCNSGTDALILALKALNIHEGDEVIVQANTFIATVLAISNVGATPILVDVDNNFMIDINDIYNKITVKTKAIIVVHLYGLCPDMDIIKSITNKNNLFLIEDCAQASGTYYNKQHVGTIGDIGCFSFYPGKNLGAYGDGGAIITNIEKHAEFIKKWKNWGSNKKYYHEVKGGNSRLDTIQAAILSVKLKYLEDWNNNRRKIAKKYNKNLTGIGDIILPTYKSYCIPSWHLYVIRTKKRDELLKYLNEHNIFAGIHYPIPIHKLEAYSELSHNKLKNCEIFSEEILSLPIYPELCDDEINHICEIISNFFNKYK